MPLLSRYASGGSEPVVRSSLDAHIWVTPALNACDPVMIDIAARQLFRCCRYSRNVWMPRNVIPVLCSVARIIVTSASDRYEPCHASAWFATPASSSSLLVSGDDHVTVANRFIG